MKTYRIASPTAIVPFFIFIALCLNACAAHFGTIPPPPASAKVRVFVMPVTGNTAHGRAWAVPHDQFKANAVRGVRKFMEDIGVYEIVPEADVEAVVGREDIPGWRWFGGDMALLKQVGGLLHADYAMIYERRFVANNYVPRMVFVNIGTGVQYEASGFMSKPLLADAQTARDTSMAIAQTCYRKIFYDAKGDILATAVRKAGLISDADVTKPKAKAKESASVPKEPPPQKTPADRPQETAKTPMPPPPPTAADVKKQRAMEKEVASIPKEPPPQKSAPELPKDAVKTSPPPERTDEVKRRDFEKMLEEDPQAESAKGKARLVVHDFDAAERLQVVSLILAEALREELFILGRFSLVNREDMVKVLGEMKLQQSGLTDEKQAVQLGKWLAANESVTGRLAVLGNSYILQAKRTDIRTMGTLGLGSLRCAAGHEEEFLSSMPDLARKLTGSAAPPPR